MATVSTKLVTADEFYDFVHRPENRNLRFDLDEGEIVEMSRPGENHGWVCGNIAWILGAYVRTIGRGYVCVNDTGLILDRDPDTVRGPDAIFYAESKCAQDMNPKWSETMPTLVVEVLSPNDEPSRTARRLDRFLEKGVRVVWMVDPDEKKVTVWWHGNAPTTFQGDDQLPDMPGLPGLRCPIAEFFKVFGV